jgi:hypothetical protein
MRENSDEVRQILADLLEDIRTGAPLPVLAPVPIEAIVAEAVRYLQGQKRKGPRACPKRKFPVTPGSFVRVNLRVPAEQVATFKELARQARKHLRRAKSE